jgi:hypothetical protein
MPAPPRGLWVQRINDPSLREQYLTPILYNLLDTVLRGKNHTTGDISEVVLLTKN